MRGHRRGQTEKRVHLARLHRPGLTKGRRVGPRGRTARMRLWADPALNRLEAKGGQSFRGERAQQSRTDPGLTNAGSTAENYDAHASVTAFAKRAISASLKVALTVKRNRAPPTGTVGGRIACARIPMRCSRWAAANTRSFLPRMTETIGPKESGATGRPAARSLVRSSAARLARLARSASASRASFT